MNQAPTQPLDLTPFSDHDFFPFAGAAYFDDGSRPLLGTLHVADWNPYDNAWAEMTDGGTKDLTVCVVWDRNGVEVVGGDTTLKYFGSKDECQLLVNILSSRQTWHWNELLMLAWNSRNMPNTRD